MGVRCVVGVWTSERMGECGATRSKRPPKLRETGTHTHPDREKRKMEYCMGREEGINVAPTMTRSTCDGGGLRWTRSAAVWARCGGNRREGVGRAVGAGGRACGGLVLACHAAHARPSVAPCTYILFVRSAPPPRASLQMYMNPHKGTLQ
jgi:hypothetical protein